KSLFTPAAQTSQQEDKGTPKAISHFTVLNSLPTDAWLPASSSWSPKPHCLHQVLLVTNRTPSLPFDMD
ncbi:hypothetical protein LEMLEM_LOCUS7678, partial [Lemmus lemmus]